MFLSIDDGSTPGRGSLGARRLAGFGAIVALAGVLGALGAGLGHRVGAWDYRFGIGMLIGAAGVAALGGLASLTGALLLLRRDGHRRLVVFGIAGAALGAVTGALPWSMRTRARDLPAIHDISTDTDDPPAFVRAAALRRRRDHPVAYEGRSVANLQRAAYPDLAPLSTPASPGRAFDAAKAALADLGLAPTDADPSTGRLEATATTLLFGFKDDVVVRVAPVPGGGARVDVRSMSRVGRHDFGANAERVRALLARIRDRLA